jgi:hypothetical protein
MPEPQLDKDNLEIPEKEETNALKGTFISVMLLGGFIIVTWIGVWALFLSR